MASVLAGLTIFLMVMVLVMTMIVLYQLITTTERMSKPFVTALVVQNISIVAFMGLIICMLQLAARG